mgnify:CR=1 FL=1
MIPVTEKEEWRDIPGTFGMYQASSLGNIRSKKKGHVHVMCKKHNSFTGYDYVILYLPSGPRTITVHRAVAMTFLPNPNGLPEVNHINEVKADNRVSNLEWVTAHQNNEHSKWKRQKPVDVFSVDGEFIATFASGSIAAKILGANKSHICKALKNNGTSCKGFLFRYGKEGFHEYPGIDSRGAGEREVHEHEELHE